MQSEKSSLGARLKEFLEDLLALRVSPEHRLRYQTAEGLLEFDEYDRRPLRVASVLAILLHVLLLALTLPSFFRPTDPVETELVILRSLAQPAAQAGGAQRPEAAPIQPPSVPKPEPILVPIPDPTPHEIRPVRRREIEETPIIQEIAQTLNLGDISAPPGPPGKGGTGRSQTAGAGSGPVQGPGRGTGGDGPYTVGGDVSNPQVITKTIPSYTDEAIKAKVQGVVWLEAVIRRDGSVGNFRVLRGLGYGLEERAIQEIANNWKFRPGMRNGQPVDVIATIEVQFSLR